MRRFLALALLLVAGIAAIALGATGPAPAQRPSGRTATAVFAGGCFWSTEHALDAIPGVISTTSGFAGGRVANPGYRQVVAGGTGHLEAVRVVYDPDRIAYVDLVARFFQTIDPLDPDGQFCDQGPQYRTAVFVANQAERRAAEAIKAAVARRLDGTVATAIRPAARFYPAEDYHQDFAARNPARYGLYRRGCGRDARLAEVWSRAR